MNKLSIKDRFNSQIKSDNCDTDYQGSDPDWRKENFLIKTEFGLITYKKYKILLEKKNEL